VTTPAAPNRPEERLDQNLYDHTLNSQDEHSKFEFQSIIALNDGFFSEIFFFVLS
jgi:hypothetical protein